MWKRQVRSSRGSAADCLALPPYHPLTLSFLCASSESMSAHSESAHASPQPSHDRDIQTAPAPQATTCAHVDAMCLKQMCMRCCARMIKFPSSTSRSLKCIRRYQNQGCPPNMAHTCDIVLHDEIHQATSSSLHACALMCQLEIQSRKGICLQKNLHLRLSIL